MFKTTEILGVKFITAKEKEILEYAVSELEKGRRNKEKNLPAGRQVIIFTPNPEQLSAASRDPKLKALLNEANFNLPDGMGVFLASKLLGGQIEARITGIDFMKNLVKTVSNRPVKTGFFGGQPHVAEEAAECLSREAGSRPDGKKTAPSITVGYASDIYDKAKMIHSDIDILFVALGFPKQERWIMEHKREIPATVIMAVGGAFDFISGRIPRAPGLVRQLGLEWLFRLIIQPWRVWRQARLLHFGALILAEALGNRLKISQK